MRNVWHTKALYLVLSAILVCVSQVALKFSFPLLVNPAKLKPHT